MPNYNKVILVGHVTKQPDIKTKGGIMVGNSAIAVNRKYKDKQETMFIDFTCFGKIAETLGSYVLKGDPLMIEGRLDFQQWESEGQKKSKHCVIVDNFIFLKGKQQSEQSNNTNDDSISISNDEDVPF